MGVAVYGKKPYQDYLDVTYKQLLIDQHKVWQLKGQAKYDAITKFYINTDIDQDVAKVSKTVKDFYSLTDALKEKKKGIELRYADKGGMTAQHISEMQARGGLTVKITKLINKNKISEAAKLLGLSERASAEDVKANLELLQDRIKGAQGPVFKELYASSLELVNAALDSYGNFFKDTSEVVSYDPITRQRKAVKMTGEAIVGLRKQEATTKIETWLREGISADKFAAKVNRLTLELLIADPKKFINYGNRGGSPLGTSQNVNLILRPEEVNINSDHYGLKTPKLDIERSYGMIGLSSLAMMEAIGDFDGDQVTLQNISELNLLYAKHQQGTATEEELKRLGIIQEAVKGNASGFNYVHHAARYTGDFTLLTQWKEAKTPEARSKVLGESVGKVDKAREQIEQISDYFDEYIKHFSQEKVRYEGVAGKTYAAMTSQERLDISRRTAATAIQARMAKISDSLVDPATLDDPTTHFLYQYIGYSGTEIIGKAFNVTYDLLINSSLLRQKGIFASGATEAMHGLSQVDRMAGFMQAINQMARDSMKPRSVGGSLRATILMYMQKYKGDGAKAAQGEVAGTKTISYLDAILKGSTHLVTDMFGEDIDSPLSTKTKDKDPAKILDPKAFNPMALNKTAKEFIQHSAKELARFQIENLYKTDPMMDSFVRESLLVSDEIIKKIGADAGVEVTNYDSLRTRQDLREQFVSAIGKKAITKEGRILNYGTDKEKQRARDKGAISLSQQLLVQHHLNSIGVMFSSKKNADEYLRKSSSFEGFDYQGIWELAQFGAQRGAYEKSIRDSLASGEFSINAVDPATAQLEHKVAALIAHTARPQTQHHPLEGLAMIKDVISQGDLKQRTGEAAEAYRARTTKYFENIDNMDTFGTNIGSRFKVIWEQSGVSLMGMDLSEMKNEASVKQFMEDMARAGQHKESLLNSRLMADRLLARGEDPARVKAFLERQTKVTDNLTDVLGVSESVIRTSSSRLENFMDMTERGLSKMVNTDTQSGAASWHVTSGVLGGVLGAGIANAIMKQDSSAEGLAAAGMIGATMINPFVVGKQIAHTKDSKEQMKFAASLIVGGGMGILAEGLTAKLIPAQIWGRTSMAVGFLASTLLATISGVAIEKALDTHKKISQGVSAEALIESALNHVEALFQAREDITEDITGTAEYMDMSGESVNLVEDDGSQPAEWLDENGMHISRAEV